MAKITNDVLSQLNTLNEWLKDVFGEDTRLSTILSEGGISEADILLIKQQYLAEFLQQVVKCIVETVDKHDGERRNDVMVRHYGLLTGKPETLQAIADSLILSRERIRQLVKKRTQIYRYPKRKQQFRESIIAIGKTIIEKQNESFESTDSVPRNQI